MYVDSKTSVKVAAGMDIAATLAIEHMGSVFRLPFYHPFILAPVLVLTYALFRWKDEVTKGVILGYRGVVGKAKNTLLDGYSGIEKVAWDLQASSRGNDIEGEKLRKASERVRKEIEGKISRNRAFFNAG